MLSVICFSKDRPMQVDAYIQSLQFYGSMPAANITILYTTSGDITYDRVISLYPDVRWVKETNFYEDLVQLVAGSENYILFGCDDVVFKSHFDPNLGLAILARDPAVFGFSLRLGSNLHSLPNLRYDGNLLRWNWREAPVGHWSYPWEVSGSIYRRDFVVSILQQFKNMTNPNRFEAFLAERIHTQFPDLPTEMASFDSSKCVTLTINRVQEEYLNDFDESKRTDPLSLFNFYNDNQKIDWTIFADTPFNQVHIDAKLFRLVAAIVLPEKISVMDLSHRSIQSAAPKWFYLRIKVWSILNIMKERFRPLLPREFLVLIKKVLGIW